MSTQPKPYITPEQYLEIERKSEYRSEYFDGVMFPMEAATMNHARIHQNLAVQLNSPRCEIVSSLLVRPGSNAGPYLYPDIVVFCGKPKLVDSWQDTLADATVIIEILSPSTGDYDRGFKFEQYRKLPSLRDYIVIAQDRIYLEHNTRLPDDCWNKREITATNVVVHLPAIECSFRVADAYQRVEFEPQA